jgi:hypothetical protein
MHTERSSVPYSTSTMLLPYTLGNTLERPTHGPQAPTPQGLPAI